MIPKQEHTLPINVSSKILRHISMGIYRSPAGALKELVSNSYDAGAKKVTINTSYPALNKIVLTDNGKGMSFENFQRIIAQIGLSEKEVGEEIEVVNSSKGIKRKVIGHYGIGFLAIGQLSEKATIISKIANTNDGFRAVLDFSQFEDLPSRENIRGRENENKLFRIGTCKVEVVQFESSGKKDSFTKIELDHVRPDVKRTILGEDTSEIYSKSNEQKPYSSNFEKILSLIRDNELKRQGKNKITVIDYSYEDLLWELSVYAPLPYPECTGFRKGDKLAEFNKLASNFEFELNVDGFILKKPYDEEFWREKGGFEPKVYKWTNDEIEDGQKVSAFMVYQPGTMIRPKKMQGVLIRNNGVSVGLYDFTYMKYPFFEGTKFASLTGEIFATSLSSAMNVDRDGFNQTADSYIALKKWFHKKLFEEVFNDIRQFNLTKESPNKKKNSEFAVEVLNLLLKKSKKIKKVEFKNLAKSEKRRIVLKGNTLFINTKHKDNTLNSANREKILLAVALIMNDLISAEDYNIIQDEVQRLKKVVKK